MPFEAQPDVREALWLVRGDWDRKQGTSWGGTVLLGLMTHIVFPSYLAGTNVISSPVPTLHVCVLGGSLLILRPTSLARCSLLGLLRGHINIPLTALLPLLWLIHHSDVN